MDGYRSSSAQAAFKVPKVPKKPAESSAARRPSATGGKLGTASSVVFFFCLFVFARRNENIEGNNLQVDPENHFDILFFGPFARKSVWK